MHHVVVFLDAHTRTAKIHCSCLFLMKQVVIEKDPAETILLYGNNDCLVIGSRTVKKKGVHGIIVFLSLKTIVIPESGREGFLQKKRCH